jgi:hypothetical protein
VNCIAYSNATFFYPNKNVSIKEFLKTWEQKYNYPNVISEHDMTIMEAVYFASVLSNKTGSEGQKDFIAKWNKLNLSDFNFERPITRFELSAILNEFDVFNKFRVDFFGHILQ